MLVDLEGAHIPGDRIKKKPELVDKKLLNYILESGLVSSPWIEEKPPFRVVWTRITL